MPLTTFSDGHIFAERSGDPPRVLALHGWMRDRSDFRDVLAGLDALLVDLPGFGLSPPPPEPWGSREYARALRPILAEFPTGAIVVAHSFGGRVALQLAAREPAGVRALILTGVPLLATGAGGARLSTRRRVASALHRNENVGVAPVIHVVRERVVAENYEHELRRIRCPVELVWGAADGTTPMLNAVLALGYLHDVRLSVHPSGDHFFWVQDPTLLRTSVERHYSSADDERASAPQSAAPANDRLPRAPGSALVARHAPRQRSPNNRRAGIPASSDRPFDAAVVGVVFGGPSPEHDVSIVTGLHALRGLAGNGWQRRALYWAKDGSWFDAPPDLEPHDFLEGPPLGARAVTFRIGSGGGFFRRRRPMDLDVVLNCCHGGPGEDGTLQSALDLAGIRYTGPSASAAALGMDKLAFGAAVSLVGLPTLPRVLLTPETSVASLPFAAPFIVKPRFGGSSIGVEVVESLDVAHDLARTSPHLRDGALLEPFIAGALEIGLALRTFPELQLSSFEAWRSEGCSELLSYGDKYLAQRSSIGPRRTVPARLDGDTARALRVAAKTVAPLLPARSVARIDFLIRDCQAWVSEINTIPGRLSSDMWIEPRVELHDLLSDMLREALERTPRQLSATGATGSVLRTPPPWEGK